MTTTELLIGNKNALQKDGNFVLTNGILLSGGRAGTGMRPKKPASYAGAVEASVTKAAAITP